MQTAQQLLESVYGYHAFRGDQADIINTLVAGDSALVLMPTGGGKSLCYQLPSLLRHGVGVIVSPLIALMQDQVSAASGLGIRAAFLNSSLTANEQYTVQQQLRAGELDLLYIAPERLLQSDTLALFKSLDVALFAIDEAHCMSQWGHDFRPEYSQLGVLVEHFPDVPRIALTATADGPTRREIANKLQLDEARQYVASFDRPNIFYRVAERQNYRRQLLNFMQLEHAGDTGIVYCLSRKKVEDVAVWLQDEGINALPYHARLPTQTKNDHLARFLREEGIVMVATIAFGMGIDKPNVRFVAHLDLPGSIEAYYQETGRAGRDGQPANAFMVYGLNDVQSRRQMVEQSEAPAERKRIEQHKLNAMLGYCELITCRRQALLRYFEESLPEPCGQCDTCKQPPATFDGTVAAQKLMSAIVRTGQRFGAGHVIDVLRGKVTDKIQQFRHHELPTFGVGAEQSVTYWRSVLRQLMARGLITADVEAYGSLRLAAECRPILRGDTRLNLREDRRSERRGQHQPGTSGSRAEVGLNAEEQSLFDSLRELRKRLADEKGVPSYVIFHDKTLRFMALHKPQSMAEFAEIEGIGQSKLEAYGSVCTELIQGFMQGGNSQVQSVE